MENIIPQNSIHGDPFFNTTEVSNPTDHHRYHLLLLVPQLLARSSRLRAKETGSRQNRLVNRWRIWPAWPIWSSIPRSWWLREDNQPSRHPSFPSAYCHRSQTRAAVRSHAGQEDHYMEWENSLLWGLQSHSSSIPCLSLSIYGMLSLHHNECSWFHQSKDGHRWLGPDHWSHQHDQQILWWSRHIWWAIIQRTWYTVHITNLR